MPKRKSQKRPIVRLLVCSFLFVFCLRFVFALSPATSACNLCTYGWPASSVTFCGHVVVVFGPLFCLLNTLLLHPRYTRSMHTSGRTNDLARNRFHPFHPQNPAARCYGRKSYVIQRSRFCVPPRRRTENVIKCEPASREWEGRHQGGRRKWF